LLVLPTDHDNDQRTYTLPFRRMATAVASLGLGMVLYDISAKLAIQVDVFRTQINTRSEVTAQILGSFPAFVKYFTVGSDYLPPLFRWLPLTVILLGVSSLIIASWRKGVSSFFAVIFMLGFIPITLRAAYIINSNTWANVGRIVYPYGFALLFFLLAVVRIKKFKVLYYSAIVLLIYFSMVIVTQETNRAYFKTIFDINKINRIAARIENVVPNLYAKQWPLVVIGDLSMNYKKYRSFPNSGNHPGLDNETFIDYRQTEFLNFFFGRDVLVRPTPDEVDTAIRSSEGRRPWPAPESVYNSDNIVVVMLEKYRRGASITWPNGAGLGKKPGGSSLPASVSPRPGK
jgi:hypothetical protein